MDKPDRNKLKRALTIETKDTIGAIARIDNKFSSFVNLKNKVAKVQERGWIELFTLFENLKVWMSVFMKLWLQCWKHTKITSWMCRHQVKNEFSM